MIADKLSLVVDSETRGDTIGVMQAVLDTQFWLATHVTYRQHGLRHHVHRRVAGAALCRAPACSPKR